MPDSGFRNRPRWSSLAREVAIVLVVKMIALSLIWLAFFSSPAARHLDAEGVAQSLLPPPANKAQPQETDRAARSASR